MTTGHRGASPTARALLALEVIQDVPGVSATELGRRLGVSERAARRYVALLREAEIPVESVPGPYGGYRLGRGVRPPPLRFTLDEVLGLTMAAVEARHGPDDPAGRALTRLGRVLPPALSATVEAMRAAAGPASDRDLPVPDPGVASDLVRAAAGHRRIRLRYAAQHPFTTEVDPWAVLPRKGLWYLLCWSHDRDARRVLRLDRVRDVVVLDQPFRRPEGLDPVATLEEHLSQGWELAVEVVIEAPVAHVRHWVPRNLGHLEAIDAGRTRLRGSTSTPDWYAVRLAEIAAPFRVVSPPELAREMDLLGRRLVEAARPDGPPSS